MARRSASRGSPAAAIIAGLLITAVTIGFVVWLMRGTRQEAEVVIRDGAVIITGQYGVTRNLADVTAITLHETMPRVGRKVNGAGLGEIRKGDYEVEGLGRCRLVLHRAQGPYIFVEAAEQPLVILNMYDAQRTRTTYHSLKSAWGR